MNASTQQTIELSAVLNLIPYLDRRFDIGSGMTLKDLVDHYSGDRKSETFRILKDAVDNNASYQKIELVNQSSTNSTEKWTDDLIQGCTFKDPEGNYYVSYRGTGDGRWLDNGKGMSALSTEMQEAASQYFDEMAEKYFVDAKECGKQIIVTGHSKGGNEAQYVYLASEHGDLIDLCISMDGQGFSDIAKEYFEKKYGDAYPGKLSGMYSINGENDFVHDLGHVVIPEENTYFVATSETKGEKFASLHKLENMISDGKGKYRRLEVNKGKPIEQKEIGKLFKKLSKEMMEMAPENRDGAALAMMGLIDKCMREDDSDIEGYLGSLDVDGTDVVDLLAHGLPTILGILLLSEEGHEAIPWIIDAVLEGIRGKYGEGGLVAFVAILPVLLFRSETILQLAGIIIGAQIIDFIVDRINLLKDISWKTKEAVIALQDYVFSALKWLYRGGTFRTAVSSYIQAHPQVSLNTHKLRAYASQLNDINGRINKLEHRLSIVNATLRLTDTTKMVRTGTISSNRKKLIKCKDYLSRTADDFEMVETRLIREL